MRIYPEYYPRFSCIGGSCGHNCCIGWEIDVDEESLARYEQEASPFGERLRAGIDREGVPHFRLCEGERCTFLNGENLCELILSLGEASLCEICSEHPRFHNFLSDRTESGLGLCCEEAGRLILGWPDPVGLLCEEDGEDGEPDPREIGLLALRKEAMRILQERSLPIMERLRRTVVLCGGEWREGEAFLRERLRLLLELERLEESWGRRLEDALADPDLWARRLAFAEQMRKRESEYEQLAVYLLYRYLVGAESEDEVAAVAEFCATSCEVMLALGAEQKAERGDFTLADQVELARELSSELEYSEENMARLLRKP